VVLGQNKYGKEYKIKKVAFPEEALALIEDHLEDAKRVRFYQREDNSKKGFNAKFKKGRLHYNVNFDGNGSLKDVAFDIKEFDVPEDSWDAITAYFSSNYPKLRIKKIQQLHPSGGDPERTVHEAFQNLMLPHINYKIIFSAKKEGKRQSYGALFNAKGNLVDVHKLL
jgi:hypothetical protein